MLVHFREARDSAISNDKENHFLSIGTCMVVQETFCNICKWVDHKSKEL